MLKIRAEQSEIALVKYSNVQYLCWPIRNGIIVNIQMYNIRADQLEMTLVKYSNVQYL